MNLFSVFLFFNISFKKLIKVLKKQEKIQKYYNIYNNEKKEFSKD